MRRLTLLAAGMFAPILVMAALVSSSGVAFASFHCMRIHAVLAGYNGNGNIQYVELRMDAPGQNFLGGQQMQFFDAAGNLKATFTFPGAPLTQDVPNASTGDSILLATQEFANVANSLPDFIFSPSNTTGTGDVNHPLQSPGGKVVWLPTIGGCLGSIPADSVAYGSATANYGTAATALPMPPDMRALRLNNLNTQPMNNSTEYALTPVSTTTFSVSPANLATDLTTPRDNARTVIKIAVPVASVGGVAEVASLPASTRGGGMVPPAWALALAAAAAATIAAGAAGWYLRRRRAIP